MALPKERKPIMARTKGSKNKATIIREEAAKSTKLEMGKGDVVTRGGEVVGRAFFKDGLFAVVIDGTGVFTSFDLDESLAMAQETVVF